MSISPYLNFNGNCREAVLFYAEVFGIDNPQIMSFGDAPPHPDYPLPEEAKNLVMHARLDIGGSSLMFSDVFPGMPFTVGTNVNIAYNSKDAEDIKSAFHKLKEGGTVVTELQETFWSKHYGQVTDKFGISWLISHEGEQMGM
ncbi:VOC family protein [Paenibacillus humicola]|uniref:VOC family protein n=1 Tax=Paenibacillus humicola TaxID=3110540 RepID=UPI00237A8E7E|nr:VOC family protein [Paenibacillus humicola]